MNQNTYNPKFEIKKSDKYCFVENDLVYYWNYTIQMDTANELFIFELPENLYCHYNSKLISLLPIDPDNKRKVIVKSIDYDIKKKKYMMSVYKEWNDREQYILCFLNHIKKRKFDIPENLRKPNTEPIIPEINF